MPSNQPPQIGPYKLTERISISAMSEVYKAHRVEVWIAGGGDQGTPADLPFYEPDEPDEPGSIALTLVLCTIEPREPAAPRIARVRLPARGHSDHAVFPLHPRTAAFTARVVVLHRQRVLQTLLLTQPADGLWRWNVEQRVHNALGPELAEREPFDAAIVVNPSTALAIGADGAGLALLPAGSDAAARGIQEILAGDQIRDEEHCPSDQASARALHRLALHGHTLWDAVVNRPSMAEHLAHARRIHIVEAREGAYLPIELFHARPAPCGRAWTAAVRDAVAALAALHAERPEHTEPLLWLTRFHTQLGERAEARRFAELAAHLGERTAFAELDQA